MTTDVTVDDFLNNGPMAVVGVSADRNKYGNIVFRDLLRKGYAVYPIHHALESVEGQECFKDVRSLPGEVESIVLVVPPQVSAQIVRESTGTAIRRIWMQPGAESAEAVQLCTDNNIAVIHHACIMIEAGPGAAR